MCVCVFVDMCVCIDGVQIRLHAVFSLWIAINPKIICSTLNSNGHEQKRLAETYRIFGVELCLHVLHHSKVLCRPGTWTQVGEVLSSNTHGSVQQTYTHTKNKSWPKKAALIIRVVHNTLISVTNTHYYIHYGCTVNVLSQWHVHKTLYVTGLENLVVLSLFLYYGTILSVTTMKLI